MTPISEAMPAATPLHPFDDAPWSFVEAQANMLAQYLAIQSAWLAPWTAWQAGWWPWPDLPGWAVWEAGGEPLP